MLSFILFRGNMSNKILSKYKIVDEESSSVKIGLYNDCTYRIEIVEKTSSSGKYSDIAKNINAVSHKNISNLKIEEDDKNFYFIDKNFGEGFSDLKADWFGSNYVSLIRCYLQIIEAVEYIHQKGFYHGNINPKNIRVDRQDNACLLDFGRCYIYAILTKQPDNSFYAPEQISQNECCQESDIYSLGLCMLKLLTESCFDSFSFENEYSDFNSLQHIYECVIEKEHLLDKTNAGLFLLIKKMLKESPDERIQLIDIRCELTALLYKIQTQRTFAIKVIDKMLDDYKEKHCLKDIYAVIPHINEKISEYRAYLEFSKDKNDRDVVKIGIGDLTFRCSSESGDHFFCFTISENPSETESMQKYGLPSDDRFKITRQNNRDSSCDDASKVIEELKEKYERKQREDKRYEIDRKSISTEEELLAAEKKTIDEKKNTQKVILRKIDRGTDTLTFELASTDDESNEIVKFQKDFKQNHKVIVQDIDNIDNHIGGTVAQTQSGNTVTISLKKYATLNGQSSDKKKLELKEDKEYFLSYDSEVEEIIWNKRNNALNQLQSGNTNIPNFIRKINRPQEFIKNDLVDINTFYNDSLDENQRLAVQKSMSLDNGCEVLIVQGPPGTGKSTTITEIVTQILKTRPHEKILITSQSNQAVDEVLKKVRGIEDKILRIGNNEEKISEIARDYLPEKVLDKLVKENIGRIDKNPVAHPNPEIQNKLRKLQKDFRQKLQYITSKIGNDSDKDGKDAQTASLFTRNIRLIFGTLLGISSWKDFREISFDTIIVDEAGRATLSELLVPCIKAKKLILVGDHKQLAPVIDDDVIEKIDNKDEVKTSFFQRLFERMCNADRQNLLHTLKYNYRAERRICDLYSDAFYEGLLETTDAVNAEKSHQLSCHSSVVWYDTGKLPNKEDKQQGTGKVNHCNAKIIEGILQNITTEMAAKKLSYDIGIITPYKAQMKVLRDKLQIKKNFKGFSIDIGTVDSFQGSDRDIIIYDCVRSGKLKNKAHIDFIADEKRLNVSLSRAKRLLVIVGDMDFLYKAQVSDKNNPFADIIEHINAHKESYEIKRVVKNA